MNIAKTITGLTSAVALMVVAAGATMAATPGQFGFTTNFTPNQLNSPLLGTFIAVQNDAVAVNNTPTQINLTNFTEFAATNTTTSFSTPFTLDLTITPDGGAAVTHTFTGTFAATLINQTQTFTGVTVNAPMTLTYNFGSLGTYVVSNLSFTPPGNSLSSTKGALSADVHFTPTISTPEPATVVPFALGGLALMGLIARKTSPDQWRVCLTPGFSQPGNLIARIASNETQPAGFCRRAAVCFPAFLLSLTSA